MKRVSQAAVVILMSISIAWGLSWLPAAEPKVASPVFQAQQPGRLTTLNLVDALVELPLELRITKANIQQSVLSVDLLLPTGVAGERFVYHDLYELTQFVWERTNNVERLIVRVLHQEDSDRKQKELLVAMEAKRSQSKDIFGLGRPASTTQLRSFLESHYHFTYTARWKG